MSNDYYILFAVILHQGDETIGHYTCVISDEATQAHNDGKYDAGTWYNCNDAHKTTIDYSKLARWMNAAGDPTSYQVVYYKIHSIAMPGSIVIQSMPAI